MSVVNRRVLAVGLLAVCRAVDIAAQEKPRTVEELRSELNELRERDAENRRRIGVLEARIGRTAEQAELPSGARADGSSLDAALAGLEEAGGEDSPLDKALAEPSPEPPAATDLWSRQVGATRLRLIDLSVDLLFAVGTSSEPDASLETLQGGGHDPHQRGFTLQNLEVSFLGAVDPYFSMETHLIYFIDAEGESQFELEEAFLTTQVLPFHLQEHGLQLELGQFFTEFGRINPLHPHAWDWLDQPVVNTRLFGPDGMRGLGLRLGWLMPLPWFSELHLGVQNARGETMASFLANDEFFEERPPGGRPFTDRRVRSLEDFVYLARLDNSWDLSDEITAVLGVSGLTGPNATGPDGVTCIYGADLLLKWRPLTSDHGYPFVIWQSEIIGRRYEADDFFDAGVPGDPGDDVALSSKTLRDWGLYTQLLYGFVRNWAAGLRYEYARGDGANAPGFATRKNDPFRAERPRLSPLIAWRATEYSRVRLQYNFDDATHLGDDGAHSVWLGFEVLLGKHPAHRY